MIVLRCFFHHLVLITLFRYLTYLAYFFLYSIPHFIYFSTQVPRNPPTVKSSHHILLQKRDSHSERSKLARRHTDEYVGRNRANEEKSQVSTKPAIRKERSYSLPAVKSTNLVQFDITNNDDWDHHRSGSIDIRRTDGTLHRLQPRIKIEENRSSPSDLVKRSNQIIRWCKRKADIRRNTVC